MLPHRLTLRNRSDGIRITYSYDELGNRLTMGDAVGWTTSTYNALSRPLTVLNPHNKLITYNYDPRSLRSLLIDPDSGRFTYSYDDAGKLKEIVNPQNDRTTFVYDHNRRSAVQRSNGTHTSYTYDVAGQTTTITHGSASSDFLKLEYVYDEVGNRTVQIEGGSTRTTWTYDNSYQLISEQIGAGTRNTFGYDPAGNRTTWQVGTSTSTYTYDRANQLLTQIGTLEVIRNTFTHDAAGNLRLEVSSPNVRTSLTWDVENRLSIYDATAAGNLLATHMYNGDGLRVERQVNATTRRFVWDGDNVLLETDANDTTTAVYTVEPNQFGPVISLRTVVSGSPVTRWLHGDALDSTRILSGPSAAILDTYGYTAFGGVSEGGGNATPNPFLWVGGLGYQNDGRATGNSLANALPYYVRARLL